MRLGTLKRRGGRAALWLLVGLLVGGTAGALGTYFAKRGKAGISGGPRLAPAEEMSYVPGEASGFIHIRVRDVWHTEGFAEVRKIVEKAGPQAFAALDESFVPAPSTLDRMTLVFVHAPPPSKAGNPPPMAPPGPPGGPKGPNQPRKNAQPPKGGSAPPPPPPVRPLPAGGGPLPVGLGAEDFMPSVGKDLKVVVLLAFKEPFDANKVRSTYLKEGAKKAVGNREYWEDTKADLAVYFPDDKVMALGDIAGVKAYLTKLAAPGGPLTSAIELAREGSRHVVASVSVAQLGINPKALEHMKGEYESLSKDLPTVLKAESLTFTLALGEETKIDVRAKFKDDAAATEGEAALRNLAKFARTKLADPKKQMETEINGKPGEPKPRPIKELPTAILAILGLGSINSLDEWLADPPLETKGNEVILTPKVPTLASVYAGVAAVSAALLVPAVDKVRDAAGRSQSSNNLKQIGIAFHNYADTYFKLPPPSWTQKPGEQPKPGGLSWRVHMLPWMDQDALYKQFHLDEPWDSEHNKKLIALMPKVYASPTATAEPGQTYYKMCTGPAATFNNPVKYSLATIPDGSSNTIFVVEGGAAVTWTKPDDFVIDDKKPLPDMKLNGNSRINVLLGDSSVRSVDLNAVKEKTLRNAICPDEGEVLGSDW